MTPDEQQIRERAQQHYTDLPYHNFKHVQTVLDSAEELLDRCRRHSIPISEDVVRTAIYFHDAGYHRDPETTGFESREAYSAHIAAQELDDLGASNDLIEQVQDCILATRENANADTPEQKIVLAADLASLASDFDTFMANARKLREEHKQLHGEKPDSEAWRSLVEATVSHYLQQDIHLTPEHDLDHGISEFHARTRRNLAKFLRKTEG
ncbi:MAG: HD domain-containing protein [Candidatus Nanohaloarchaea archaeon]|nr:HD domain-containing protein [Candidatus Nanohaloarchaea archaeon]